MNIRITLLSAACFFAPPLCALSQGLVLDSSWAVNGRFEDPTISYLESTFLYFTPSGASIEINRKSQEDSCILRSRNFEIVAPLNLPLPFQKFNLIPLKSDHKGRVYLGGTESGWTTLADKPIFLARFDENWNLDTAFADDGAFVLNPATEMDYRLLDVFPVEDKTFLAINKSSPGAAGTFILALDDTGKIDSTFGTNGIVLTPYGIASFRRFLDVKPEGDIYFAAENYQGIFHLFPNGTDLIEVPSGYSWTNDDIGYSIANNRSLRHFELNGLHTIYASKLNGGPDKDYGFNGTITIGVEGEPFMNQVFILEDGSSVYAERYQRGNETSISVFSPNGTAHPDYFEHGKATIIWDEEELIGHRPPRIYGIWLIGNRIYVHHDREAFDHGNVIYADSWKAFKIPELDEKGDLFVYPNPTTGEIRISCELSQPNTEATIDLYDCLGRMALPSEEINNMNPTKVEHVVNLPSTLIDGTYILVLRYNDQVQAQRIILARP